jgi:hypothetical protein
MMNSLTIVWLVCILMCLLNIPTLGQSIGMAITMGSRKWIVANIVIAALNLGIIAGCVFMLVLGSPAP